MTDPIFFIRFPPGASGHFIACLLMSLATDVTLTNKNTAHYEIVHMLKQNNDWLESWNNSWLDPIVKNYKTHGLDLVRAINYIKTRYNFTMPAPYQYFVIPTHTLNPDPLVLAYSRAKLINITFTSEDQNQIAYNVVTKEVTELMSTHLRIIQNRFNRLKNIELNDLNVRSDLRLLAYIRKFGYDMYHSRYNNHIFPDTYDKFDLAFSDIASKKIISTLDALIDFTGIDVSQDRRNNAITLIHEYADAQLAVPWALDLHDYT